MLAALGCALVLAGCGTVAYDRIKGATATLTFSKGYLDYNPAGAGQASVQFYSYQHDPRCQRVEPTKLGIIDSEPTKSHPAAAGRRIVITAESSLFNNTTYPMVKNRKCQEAAGFVPIAGHNYDITQRTDEAGCRLKVIDGQTGQPPPDLRRLEAKSACTDYLREGARDL
jgi:hypothetical protein